MKNSQNIKEKVKERYSRVALKGDSCCDPLGSSEGEGGCCSGKSRVILRPNNHTLISINDELKSRLIDSLKRLSIVTPGEKCSECLVWLTSHYALTLTLEIIDKISSNIYILIQQGKNDSQASIQQALLLQQELTDVGHPDHKLITYPDFGHAFYPSSQWVTAYGPMEPKVLEDLFGWLSDPVRDFKEFTILRQQ